MADETSRMSFGYWSDPLCIWAYVAQAKLDHLLEHYGHALVADYHVVPVFGSVAWRFSEGPWAKAGVEGRVHATAAIARRFGHEGITGEVWRNACPSSSWAPGAAVKAVGILDKEGAIAHATMARFQWRLRCAFFEGNRNIAERSVQLEVAEQCSIPRAGIEAALDDGRALALLWEDVQLKDKLGIQGSPTYVFDGGRATLYGNVSEGIITSTAQDLLGDGAYGSSKC